MNHWNTPLGLATRHDKARARAAKLRAEADRLDAQAEDLKRRFHEAQATFDAEVLAALFKTGEAP